MKATALRSFDHNGKITKGDDLTDKFDIITLRALKRSGLINLDEDGEPTKTPKKPPEPTVGSLGKAPKPKAVSKPPKAVSKPPKAVSKPPKAVSKPPKAGAKSAASQVAPASLPPTLPESGPGSLPPPLPGASS